LFNGLIGAESSFLLRVQFIDVVLRIPIVDEPIWIGPVQVFFQVGLTIPIVVLMSIGRIARVEPML
jgi:hypothetical protein